jgi:hypothetical protein
MSLLQKTVLALQESQVTLELTSSLGAQQQAPNDACVVIYLSCEHRHLLASWLKLETATTDRASCNVSSWVLDGVMAIAKWDLAVVAEVGR